MTPALKLRWHHQPAHSALATTGLAAEWDRLNAARGALPFLDAAVVRLALQHFGQGDEQLAVGRNHEGLACAMVVLNRVGRLRWSTFQASQIPLGAWVAEAGLSLNALSRSLVRHAPVGPCLALSFTQVDPLTTPRESEEPSSIGVDYIDTGWIEVQGSFEDYWAVRGKNLRQNMRKQRNKLTADGVQTQILVWRAAEDMAAALVRYGALESAGWKADEGTAIHPDNAQGRFYQGLFEAAAARGEACVFEYRFDARTVAMNLCLLRAGQLIVLKTAYDESIRTLSPAFLLREEELQQFFAPGSAVRRIEYFGKLMDWHTKLTDNKRGVYHHTRYRWAWVKRLALARQKQRGDAAHVERSGVSTGGPGRPDEESHTPTIQGAQKEAPAP